MHSNNSEIKEINLYFKKFVSQYDDFYFDVQLNATIKKINNETETDFSENWENLIALMEIIERIYNVKSIVTENNYFRFEFHDGNIQDKGVTKIDALYSCCYKTLKKYWSETIPNFNRGLEPFDLDDLK